MSSTIVVKQCGLDNYEWLQLERPRADAIAPAPAFFVGDGDRLQQHSENGAAIIVLADAQKVSLRQVPFEAHERKLLSQTLPYTLEDDYLEDVEQLQFALGPLQGNSASLAIINREDLQDSLGGFEDGGIDVKQLVSELSFIPLAEQGWSILLNDEGWLVRTDQYQGFALHQASVSLGLQLLLDEAPQPPETVTVYCAPERQSAVIEHLPALLHSRVNWQSGDYWQVMAAGLQQFNAQNQAINLLQGEYARQLPWRKWWVRWRLAAMLLVAAVVIQFAVSYTQLSVLEAKNIELRTAIERSYRSVVPRGAVMAPEKQLRRKVNALKGSGGNGFVSLLEKIAPVITAIDGMSIQTMNYSEKQSEVRLTVIAEGFDDVETARTNLEKQGLRAELSGSSADGDKTRARLKIRG